MADRRLLILDDEAEVGRIIGLIAEGAGFEWRSTTQPDEFFDELDTWQPTHLAIDLMMPEMDGVQVMRQLSERGCKCRVVITSGVGSRVMDAAMRSGVEHGLDVRGVVPKPFSALTLRVLLLDEPDDWPSAPDAQDDSIEAEAGQDFVSQSSSRKKAVLDKQFSLFYQPKLEAGSAALSGFEALVQLTGINRSPDRPGKIIDELDMGDAESGFTASVLNQSIAWLGKNFEHSDVSLSLNISVAQLLSPVFLKELLNSCEKNHVETKRIIIELNETSAMEDPTRSLDALTRFRVKGFQLSLDDFGTGYSSMVQLVRLPFSEIKVDASFVREALTSAESKAIVKSIIELGHSLDLAVTAEGVEDAQSAQLLESLKCDFLQGEYIAAAMTGDEVLNWLAGRD
ncbi:MAG: EAL domain-containing response regulator [Pseudohongiellaceae bacterium]|nr:EAL domain-containing response regulator [Pseudohongiellaceae bacterium]